MSAPPPEITSAQTYQAGWDQWPPGARGIIASAERAGWAVRTGFSRGSVPGRAQDTYKTGDLVGVWVDGYGRRGVAWWKRDPEGANAWTVDATAIWAAPGAIPFPYANLTEFRAWLVWQGDAPPSFFTTARDRVFAARERARKSADTVGSQP